MGVSHRNDAAAFATGRPNEADATVLEKSPDSKTDLAIVLPVIFQLDVIRMENLYGVGEVNTSFFQHLESLGFIVLNL
jgi:hypothetical protein